MMLSNSNSSHLLPSAKPSAKWRPVLLLIISGLLLFPGRTQLLSADDNGTLAGQPGPSLSRTDKDFLRDAAEQNQAAIELGQLAEQKGFSATARNFARNLVAQRSHAQQELL